MDTFNKAGLSIPNAVPKKWVVDCAHAGQGKPALKYLARYLYRGIISEQSIMAHQDGQVTFKYTDFLAQQAGLKRAAVQTGAVTLIQRFGSAGNLNIHLHCLFLEGVYRIDDDVPVFQFVCAPTAEQLQTLLTKIIKRIMTNLLGAN